MLGGAALAARLVASQRSVRHPLLFPLTGKSNGEGGVRTHEGLTALPLFESGAFNQLSHLSKTHCGAALHSCSGYHRGSRGMPRTVSARSANSSWRSARSASAIIFLLPLERRRTHCSACRLATLVAASATIFLAKIVAEERGFEPLRVLRPYLFSRQALSAGLSHSSGHQTPNNR